MLVFACFVNIACDSRDCPTCPPLYGMAQQAGVRFVGRDYDECYAAAAVQGWLVSRDVVLCPACIAGWRGLRHCNSKAAESGFAPE